MGVDDNAKMIAVGLITGAVAFKAIPLLAGMLRNLWWDKYDGLDSAISFSSRSIAGALAASQSSAFYVSCAKATG
jgi:hypothetical protein